ncbi:hypothetical protein JOC70_001889 [Clostridium pascui]|nr:hypothetical protein [Clostridium pascui]
MSNFKDFDLDLKKVRINNSQSETLSLSTRDCLESIIDLSKAQCSNPSTHCSPSDMTACRYGVEPGNVLRC